MGYKMVDVKIANDYSFDRYYRIVNDTTGEYIEVGPDTDSLDLVNILYVDDSGKCTDGIALNDSQLDLLVKALSEIISKRKKEA